MPGHDLGHGPPTGLDWKQYVSHFVAEAGGWAALADTFVDRAAGVVDTPLDIQSVEKGLRRLAARAHRPGGQYGRWMLRFFGVPSEAEIWARWLAQYHGRFADLPTSVRLEQLRQWDRPPVSESPVAAWVHVGMASVHHRMRDLDACTGRLAAAMRVARNAGAAAQSEIKLLQARIATDGRDRDVACQLFDEVDALIGNDTLTATDRLCYRARLNGQRAYHLTRPLPGDTADYAGAIELFEAIEEDPMVPFACFRRNSGLAWCTWKLGDAAEGARLAQIAAEYAGDGGFIRFRIMALNMLSQMVTPKEGREITQRATRLAKMLEDDDLLARVAHRIRALGR
ncbi:MAG: hypothetical protein ACE366_07940 [Bradymonadia bacterium]